MLSQNRSWLPSLYVSHFSGTIALRWELLSFQSRFIDEKNEAMEARTLVPGQQVRLPLKSYPLLCSGGNLVFNPNFALPRCVILDKSFLLCFLGRSTQPRMLRIKTQGGVGRPWNWRGTRARGTDLATPRPQLFRQVPLLSTRRRLLSTWLPGGEWGSGQVPPREGEDPTRSLRSAGLAPALQKTQ